MTLACDWPHDRATPGRVVPVLRAGVLVREACRRGGRGEVAAVFDRSLYVRAGGDFICIGEPGIGNGPTTLIVSGRLSRLGLRQGEAASIADRSVAIGDLRFSLDRCETWRPPPWPACAAVCPIDTCAALADALRAAPPEGFARAVFGAPETPLARIARSRIARFAAWLSATLSRRTPAEPFAPTLPPASGASGGEGRRARSARRGGGHLRATGAADAKLNHPPPLTPPHRASRGGRGIEDVPRESPAMEEAIAGLLGLGPGLTPSGDDFLIGALAMLDALGERKIHAALARAVTALAPALTSPLSASFLRAAAGGHVGENLCSAIALVLLGDVGAAVAAARRIGHASGWDMLAGAAIALRIVPQHPEEA